MALHLGRVACSQNLIILGSVGSVDAVQPVDVTSGQLQALHMKSVNFLGKVHTTEDSIVMICFIHRQRACENLNVS